MLRRRDNGWTAAVLDAVAALNWFLEQNYGGGSSPASGRTTVVVVRTISRLIVKEAGCSPASRPSLGSVRVADPTRRPPSRVAMMVAVEACRATSLPRRTPLT